MRVPFIHICICAILLCGGAFAQNNSCFNTDFESTAPGSYTAANGVNGYSISSQTYSSCNTNTVWTPGSLEFSIVSTPILGVPVLGSLGNSPLGGTKVAQLNSTSTNTSVTRLTQTIVPTNLNSLYKFAFATVMQDGHACCSQSGFRFRLLTCQGNTTACTNLSMTPSGPNCPSGAVGFSVSNGASWCDWQVRTVDLSPYIGSCVIIEISVNDCTNGDHYATLYFDAQCPQQFQNGVCICLPDPNPVKVNFCAGSGVAQLVAPLGYVTYSWVAPFGAPVVTQPNNTTNIGTIFNPVSGTTYTLNATNAGGCTYVMTVTIFATTVSVQGIGSSSTCLGGASGGATVVAAGSALGYNYAWVNNTNSVVGTASTVANLASGVYSVTVSAPGCGTAVASVTVGVASPSVISLIAPYCNSAAYLQPPTAGTNFQWYGGLSAISASLGGTASSITVSNPINASVYRVAYLSNQGCRDSVQFTLYSTPPGSVAISFNKLICHNANNGQAVISITPAAGAPAGTNSYSVFSLGLTPSLTASLTPTPAYSFSVNNLAAFGTYSAIVFDGACKYSTTFTTNTLPATQFTLGPPLATLCPGQQTAAGVSFTAIPGQGQYTYSWSPATFLAAGVTTIQNTVITPTAAAGTINTIIYTVVVTPTAANCPITKTLSISAARAFTPVISPIPTLCASAAPYTIAVTPLGGTFVSSPVLNPAPIGSLSGVLNSSLAVPGLNTFTYTNKVSICSEKSVANYNIVGPVVSIGGNTLICLGQSATLTATGANGYTWTVPSNSSSVVVSPATTTSYTLSASNFSSPCVSKKTVTVIVNPRPNILIAGTFTVCNGKPATLTASGANSYTWNNTMFSNSIVVSPLSQTIYSVAGTGANNCTNSAIVTVSVMQNPTVSMYGDLLLCFGKKGTLYSNGADIYLWNTGWALPNIPISPTVNTSYTVVGTNTVTGCNNFAAGIVTVTVCDDVKDNFRTEGFKVFPNPNAGEFMIDLLFSSEVFVYGQTGALIYKNSFEPGSHTIDLLEKTNGIYFLKVVSANRTSVVKLIKGDK